MIESISADNPDLAAALNLWLADFNFEKISELIESQYLVLNPVTES